jgi:hypothetical protein
MRGAGWRIRGRSGVRQLCPALRRPPVIVPQEPSQPKATFNLYRRVTVGGTGPVNGRLPIAWYNGSQLKSSTHPFTKCRKCLSPGRSGSCPGAKFQDARVRSARAGSTTIWRCLASTRRCTTATPAFGSFCCRRNVSVRPRTGPTWVVIVDALASGSCSDAQCSPRRDWTGCRSPGRRSGRSARCRQGRTGRRR